jgi:hypothetical protein
LQYVRQTFGLPAVEPSATAGWANAKFKHTDKNFPDAWVPLWFSIDTIPEGHVVLRAPDGRIYSTSTNTKTPYVHPNLDHLIWFYGDRVEPQYRLNLRYLGWSEDISNTRVVENVEDDDMGHVDSLSDAAISRIAQENAKMLLNWNLDRAGGPKGQLNLAAFLAWSDANFAALHAKNAELRAIIEQLTKSTGTIIDAAALAKAVNDDAAKRLAK